MLKHKKTKIIVTLGPATNTEEALRNIKARGVDFVRINMSHSTTDDLRYFIALAKKVGIPFIVDTEGSQIRTGMFNNAPIYFEQGQEIVLTNQDVLGDYTAIHIRPPEILRQLEAGDIVYCDFDSLILRVQDMKNVMNGSISAQVISSGSLGNNKGVVVDAAIPNKRYDLPTLSPKDYESIAIGLSEGVGHVAASFMRSGECVDEVRRATEGAMDIISKIECVDGLEHFEEIIQKSDALLIDRGDLSKEIAIERVPLASKMIIQKANAIGKDVYVATNLLETMIEKPKPTRAEIHDIEQTLLDGADGLILAAETAIGKFPFLCVNTLMRTIAHVESESPIENTAHRFRVGNYLESGRGGDSLVTPHGGVLVDCLVERPDDNTLSGMPHICVSDEHFMDAEQIALGSFSPLSGFMGKRETLAVLDTMRLPDGTPWPIPLVLDVGEEEAAPLHIGEDVVLSDKNGEPFAILHLGEKFSLDTKMYAKKLYGAIDQTHPGVQMVFTMRPVLLAGNLSVFRRFPSEHKCYEITPRQARRLFEDMGWRTIVGFHTRNVPHRGHEFIQAEALKRTHADGLFVHPVIGKKKKGDFHSAPIIKGYEYLTREVYPEGTAVFGTYATFSRYAGPREALFTALCRKNFGCSHFVVGRDHTGVGDFYHSKASHDVFNEFDDLGIEPVIFDKVFYSAREKRHIHEGEERNVHTKDEKLHISGTEARNMLLSGKELPEWFMRPELSRIILDLKNGEKLFVE